MHTLDAWDRLSSPGLKRLRHLINSAGLKQSVCSSFDSSALSSAHRCLWDYCSKELEQLGLPYHARRGSDKRHLSDVLIADLLLAFDKLDLNDNLLPIYCEAVDLIMLPCLAVDPISERFEANANCLHSVADKMNGLPPKVSDAVTSALSAPLTSCCDSLNYLVNNVASQVQQLVSCVDSLKVPLPPMLILIILLVLFHQLQQMLLTLVPLNPELLVGVFIPLGHLIALKTLSFLDFLKPHCWLLSLILMMSPIISLVDLSRFLMRSV